MNERIRELADQILPNEKEFHQGDPKQWGYFFTGEELEKFAELIVKECVNIIQLESHNAIRNNTYMGDDVPASVTQAAIKKHFGV
jgi:hypothetical protein